MNQCQQRIPCEASKAAVVSAIHQKFCATDRERTRPHSSKVTGVGSVHEPVFDHMFCNFLRRVAFALVLALGCFGGSRLAAATNGFVVPSFRGGAESRVGYWEVFTVPIGEPGNAPEPSSATTQARFFQTDTNAFLTGTGNIYNMGVSQFRLTDETPFVLGTVVLQTRTVGSELSAPSMELVYLGADGEVRLKPQSRYELNRTAGQGFNVSTLWQWDLTGKGIKAYRLEFAAAGSSVSFDSLTLDTAAQFAKAFPEQPFPVPSTPATLARWMYPFNGNPGDRPTASVFGSLGSSPDFDSRDAQYLLGWNTARWATAGRGASNYWIRRARVTLTFANDRQYVYQGTLRDYRSYFPTNDPRYLPPTTSGASVDLFGAGFRGGYTSLTYPQAGPWGVNPAGGFYSNRVAYAAGFDTNGILVDVSHNVGDDGTNEISGAFEVAPFAVGQLTNVASGELVPLGSRMTFDLNLADPQIYGYVQQGLHDGNLSFVVTSLVDATLNGPASYPLFYTIFSPLASPDQYPLLDLEVQEVRPSRDSDADGLPDDAENFWFGSLIQGAAGDPDADGATTGAELAAGTDPSRADSVLRITLFDLGSGEVTLRSTLAPGRSARLESGNALNLWAPVASPATAILSDWLSKESPGAEYPSPVFQTWRAPLPTAEQQLYRVTTP